MYRCLACIETTKTLDNGPVASSAHMFGGCLLGHIQKHTSVPLLGAHLDAMWLVRTKWGMRWAVNLVNASAEAFVEIEMVVHLVMALA